MLSGALGLQIIVRRLGVELGEQQFSKINGIDERELTFKEIKAIASEHSVICRAVKSNLDGLGIALEKQPVLAFLKNGRYVIVIKLISEDGVPKTITIIDPKASTPKPENIDIDKFNELWSGTGFLFKKSRKLEKTSGTLTLSAIFDEVLEDKWLAVQLILIILFINIFALSPIVFLIIVLDKVVNYESYATLYVVASGVLIAHIFNFLLSYYKTSIINLAAAKIEAKYGMQIFSRLINLPVSTFQKQSAQFPNLGNSLNTVRQLIIHKFLGIITDIVSVLVFTPILLFYSPLLGSVVIGACLLNSLITAIHKRRSQSVQKDYNSYAAERQQVLNSVSDGFIDIKRLGLEKDIISEWKIVEGNYLRSNDRNMASNAFLSEVGTLINNILTVVVLFLGVNLVFAGSLSAGVLIGVNMLIGKIFRPTQSLVEFPGEMAKLSQMLSSLSSAGSLSSENVNSGNFHDIVGGITFRDVGYAKDEATPQLEAVSFSIDMHETLGVCAENSDTSSTLAHLLQGLYPPNSGSILIDGNDLSSFNLQHLRANVSLVDNTNHFFSGSLRDNFQKVLPNANNDRIEWACKMANLLEDMQEQQITLESQVGDLKDSWSKDFQIKLSLARAIIRNPKVLILDDILSEMTADSILTFKANFDILSKSRTVILISKDIYNLSLCKKIMYFDGSKMVQFGATSAILSEDGPVKELLKKQLKVISPQFERYTSSLARGVR